MSELVLIEDHGYPLISIGEPAPRPGRPDLAGLGSASRDEGAQTEAPDLRAVEPSPAGLYRHATGDGGPAVSGRIGARGALSPQGTAGDPLRMAVRA